MTTTHASTPPADDAFWTRLIESQRRPARPYQPDALLMTRWGPTVECGGCGQRQLLGDSLTRCQSCDRSYVCIVGCGDVDGLSIRAIRGVIHDFRGNGTCRLRTFEHDEEES